MYDDKITTIKRSKCGDYPYGYHAEYDEEDDVWGCKLTNTGQDLIMFEAETIADIEREYELTVNEYLEDLKKLQKT